MRSISSGAVFAVGMILHSVLTTLLTVTPAVAQTTGTLWRVSAGTVDNNTTIEFHLKSPSGDTLTVVENSTKFVDFSGTRVLGLIWGNGLQQLSFQIGGSYGYRHGVYDVRAEIWGYGRKKLAETSLGHINIDCWEHKAVKVSLPVVAAPVDLSQVEFLQLSVKSIDSGWCVGEDHKTRGVGAQALTDLGNGIGTVWGVLTAGPDKSPKTPPSSTPVSYVYGLRYYCAYNGKPDWAEAVINAKSAISLADARQLALDEYAHEKAKDGRATAANACEVGGYQIGDLLPPDLQPQV